MPYQLVYLPKSGNKNYWTNDHGFTHKLKNHRFWDDSAQLIADFPVLKAQYPTVFNNRRDDRFYIHDDNDVVVIKLMEKLIVPAASQPIAQPPAIPIKYNAKEYYVIRANVGERQYYYDSGIGKSGALIVPGAGEIRFWKHHELDKVIATAQNLCRNKNFLRKLPGLLPESLAVINIRTNQTVWPAQPSRPVAAIENTDQPSQPTDLLEKVKIQLSDHFATANHENLLNDQGVRPGELVVDLERFDAARVFAAFCYLTEALAQRITVNKLLDNYDQSMLQDYLHTVELTDPHQLDNDAFVESLRQTRQGRRKIKDLSILLNTIGDNIDQATILKHLLSHQSLHNQYHYRNHELGNRLLEMIKPTVENEEI
ncbi:hypothetical protein [Limosilactobacillus sp.]|uniref:hypothetical protein n=1 Tax=Limosilactobacillus sp. TaxID=2773925 RepID=UPI003F10E553